MNYTERRMNESLDDSVNMDHDAPLQTCVIVNCILNAPLMLVSILGNALVLAAILRTPSIHSTSMIMLCSLAVSDLLVGIFVQPVFIARELTRIDAIKRLFKILAFGLCGVSLSTTTAISVDRCLALQYPMRYQSAIAAKPRVIYTSIVIIWISNCLFSTFYAFNWPVYYVLTASGVCLCIFISMLSYIRIYQIVRQHQIQIHVQHWAVHSSTEGNNFNMVRIKNSAMNTSIFYIAMILCYIPLIIFLCSASIAFNNLSEVWGLVDTVVFLNSSINPILYCWRIGELRAAVIKTLRKILCTQH